jgi:hypothetical protein
MSFTRLAILATALAAGLAAPASAATFNIAFTQTGLGDSGPDWFGTFETGPGTGFVQVTQFDATIGGTRFTALIPELGITFLDGTTTVGGGQALSGFVADVVGVDVNTGITLLLQTTGILVLNGLLEDGSAVRTWGFGSSCSIEFCRVGNVLGTYTLARADTPEPPVVPLPASAALLPLGLAALAMIRRRRATSA